MNDASTDGELVAYLEEAARRDPRVRLLHNAANLGFVGTANRGMREADGRDVLLLNSDTIVTAGFLQRMQAAAYADGSIAIVSPLTNNATICSVPDFCRPNPIPEGFTVDSFGALIAETSLELRPDLVTAHGFCMYIPACVLARAGYFDEEHFGRGYGEENDFCERALALGFRIRLADDTFVYHAGGASFDAAATSAQSTANYRTLVRLHPGYFPKVARFIEQNPLGPVHANLRLALRRHGSSAPALLALLHASFDQPGGGTEHHVRDLLQSFGLPRAVVAVPQADGIHVTEILDGRLAKFEIQVQF